MYNLFSVIFLLWFIFSSGTDLERAKLFLMLSIGFAIAGAIGSISSRISDILNSKIVVKNCLNGDTEINIERKKVLNDE